MERMNERTNEIARYLSVKCFSVSWALAQFICIVAKKRRNGTHCCISVTVFWSALFPLSFSLVFFPNVHLPSSKSRLFQQKKTNSLTISVCLVRPIFCTLQMCMSILFDQHLCKNPHLMHTFCVRVCIRISYSGHPCSVHTYKFKTKISKINKYGQMTGKKWNRSFIFFFIFSLVLYRTEEPPYTI